MTTITPNHHAHHPPFRGLGGLAAAVSMLAGRDGDAELAMRLVDLGPDDRLVDLGCGPGAGARLAAARAATVTGIDPAEVMLRVARTVDRRSGARYLQGSAEQLPLEDGAATVAWALASVHHWADVPAGLREVHRILAPGGRFLAIERRIEAGARGHASHGWTPAQAAELASLAREAGFVDVEVGEHGGGRSAVLAVVAVRP